MKQPIDCDDNLTNQIKNDNNEWEKQLLAMSNDIKK